MLIDGRTLPPGHEFDADVCIIGAGAAGIALAGVLLLESGGLDPDPVAQSLYRGEVTGHAYLRLERPPRAALRRQQQPLGRLWT